MEYVIIGAAAWLGVSVLTAAGWTWMRTESRQQREIEEQEDLARALMRVLPSHPEGTDGDVQSGITPARPAQRIAWPPPPTPA